MILESRIKNEGACPVRDNLPKSSANSNEGFIALISVILIAAVLIILVAIISTSNFFTRFNVLDYENKKISSALAEACAQTALVKLASNNAYVPASGGDQVLVETGKTCKVCNISGSNPYTIWTRAFYKNTYSNFVVIGTLGATNFTINSWKEEPAYSGGTLCNVP